MWYPFLALAMQSPGRQRTLRRAAAIHVLMLLAGAWALEARSGPHTLPLFGQLALITGIVEGAVLIGWRLTQLPKSRALEFLLASPLRPRRVFLAEAVVGLGRLALVTFAGVPVLAVLWLRGYLQPPDLVLLLLMPFTWGAITGLGLTTWAYEPLRVRRIGEAILFLLILLYLIVGVLAGENLNRWLSQLPGDTGQWFRGGFTAFHVFNPFSVMQYWMEPANGFNRSAQPAVALERALGLELAGLVVVGLLLARTASRLKGHFDERHYSPKVDDQAVEFGRVGDRPLSWWAVRRVLEYSGRINLWLAGGFGVLYAAYTVGEGSWPLWMGRRAFQIFDLMGGVPALTTALVVLAAVPAAFQYGLWDSNAQDRCRRLELLLLTHLDARDYWDAAAAAAWRRGRGYFFIALLLWGAAAVAHKATVLQVVSAVASGVLLWALYFALGFRAFARGMQANGLGSFLTLAIPVLTFVAQRLGGPALGSLLPPGFVYNAAAQPPTLPWLFGPLLAGALALVVGRRALASCNEDLRQWYDQHHGRKLID